MNEPPYEPTLRMLAEAHKDELVLKATLRRQLWEEYKQRMLLAQYRSSRLANEAKAQGASMSAIGRAVGTSNWKTIKTLIGLVEDEFAADNAALVEEQTVEKHVLADPNGKWELDLDTMDFTLKEWVNWRGQTERTELVMPSRIRSFYDGGPELWAPEDTTNMHIDIGYSYEITEQVRAALKGQALESSVATPAEDDFASLLWAAEGTEEEKEDW